MVAVGPGNIVTNDSEPSRNPLLTRLELVRPAATIALLVPVMPSIAGTMMFVYIHIVVFGLWMLFAEKNPWQTLTLIVSLEAIFLSTFVMIGQNRQAAFAAAKANHDFVAQEQELQTNTELTRQIHELTTQIHENVMRQKP